MKYENPELTALTPAINAIQGTGPNKGSTTQPLDSQFQTNLPMVTQTGKAKPGSVGASKTAGAPTVY